MDDSILYYLTMISAGIGVVMIMAYDATGVGIADDVMLSKLFGAFAKGAQMACG